MKIPDDFPVDKEGCLCTLLWVTLPAVFPGPDFGEDCTQMKSVSLCQDQVCPPDIQADHHLLWASGTPLCPSSFWCNFTNTRKARRTLTQTSNHWCEEKRFTHSFWIYIQWHWLTQSVEIVQHRKIHSSSASSQRFHVPATTFTPKRRRFSVSGKKNETYLHMKEKIKCEYFSRNEYF